MSLSPLELVVLAFPTGGLARGLTATLDRLRGAGDVNIVDALVIRKGGDGLARGVELADAAELRALPATYVLADMDMLGLISGEDVDEVAAVLDPGATAVALLVEHCWAGDVAAGAANAGGVLVASVRIPARHAAAKARLLDT